MNDVTEVLDALIKQSIGSLDTQTAVVVDCNGIDSPAPSLGLVGSPCSVSIPSYRLWTAFRLFSHKQPLGIVVETASSILTVRDPRILYTLTATEKLCKLTCPHQCYRWFTRRNTKPAQVPGRSCSNRHSLAENAKIYYLGGFNLISFREQGLRN